MVGCGEPVLDLQQLHHLVIDTIPKLTSLVWAKASDSHPHEDLYNSEQYVTRQVNFVQLKVPSIAVMLSVTEMLFFRLCFIWSKHYDSITQGKKYGYMLKRAFPTPDASLVGKATASTHLV